MNRRSSLNPIQYDQDCHSPLMLRTGSLGQFDRAEMGQGSSRGDSTDPTAAPMNTMMSNGHVTGVGMKANSPSASMRLDGFARPPKSPSSGRGSLKRSRDERESGDYGSNDDYRMRFAGNANKHSRRLDFTNDADHPLSPTSKRQSFIPERRDDDDWRSNTRHQYQRDNSSGSNPAHRQGRTDQWIPSSSSPRSISPPVRPRLGARTNSAFSEQSASHATRPVHERRASESAENARYPNLKWTNPEKQPARVTNGFRPRHSLPATVLESPLSPVEDSGDENDSSIISKHPVQSQDISQGIEGAPKGPKRDPQALLSSLHAGNRKPYIFITGKSLPPQYSTLDHLFKFLTKWVKDKSNVSFDARGWYIYFDSTEKGLDRLDQCYWAKNGQELFSMYTLDMFAHPNGLEDIPDVLIKDKHGRPGPNNATLSGDGLPKRLERATEEELATIPALPSVQIHTMMADPNVEIGDPPRAASLELEPPVKAGGVPTSHSSPLRVPSAFDEDDNSSSISGLTGSDISASRLSRCHTCQKPPDVDALVQCSTCPRRYHPRCHPKPMIPLNLAQDHSWQCRRCIKKKVLPKSRLSISPLVMAASPAPSVGQPDERPAKKRRLEDTLPISMLKDHIIDDDRERSERLSYVTDSPYEPDFDDQMHMPNGDHPYANEPPPPIAVNSDQVRFQEAEDLVEQSFSTLDATARVEEKSRKPATLNYTRKKLSQPKDQGATGGEGSVEDISRTSETQRNVVQVEADADHSFQNATPKRERHKWKGGGADKAIIQAGMLELFPDTSPRRGIDEPSQDTVRNESLKRRARDARSRGLESPEESRTTSTANGLRIHEPTQSSPTQSSPRFKLTLKNTKPGEREDMGRAKPQIGPSRMKPSAKSGARCRNCNRPIAFSPSGTKLCSTCKKAGLDKPTPPAAEEKIMEDMIDPGHAGPVMPTAAERIENGLLDLVRSPPTSTPPPETDLAKSSSKLAEDDVIQRQPWESDAACEKCRSRHKRCMHRSAYPGSAVRQADVQEESTDDDLDFWNTADEEDTRKSVKEKTTSHDKQKAGNGVQTEMDEERGGSFSLSPAPEEGASFAAKVKKRTSFARAAKSEYDIGDAHFRPNNSYKKLIGMALCAAEDHRLSANKIIKWIEDNIPGYRRKEGHKWEGGITATLSMNRDQDNKPGPWRTIKQDGARKNASCQYQLMPGQEDKMLHWDPVLKQPVSPMQRRADTASPKQKRTSAGETEIYDSPIDNGLAETTISMTQEPKKRLKLKVSKPLRRPAKHAPKSVDEVPGSPVLKQRDTTEMDMEVDELQMPDPESSDEEPLARIRKHRTISADERTRRDDDKPANLAVIQRLAMTTAALEKSMAAQMIKEDAEFIDTSAKSLFKEWPDYDPANTFDRAAKIAEIRRRPNRKQKLFNPNKSDDPWARWKPTREVRNDISIYSTPKSSRFTHSSRVDGLNSHADDEDENAIHYESIERMFDLPEQPVAILHDRSIAYRDGVRNEFDGTLRRAKKIYMTGYVGH